MRFIIGLVSLLSVFFFSTTARCSELKDFEDTLNELQGRFVKVSGVRNQGVGANKDYFEIKFMKLKTQARAIQEKSLKKGLKDVDLPKGVNQIIKAYEAATVRSGGGTKGTFTPDFFDDLKRAMRVLDDELLKIKDAGIYDDDKGKEKAKDAGKDK